jgi:hypothetical protein
MFLELFSKISRAFAKPWLQEGDLLYLISAAVLSPQAVLK